MKIDLFFVSVKLNNFVLMQHKGTVRLISQSMQITEIPDAMGLNYNKYKHRASAGVTAIGPAVRKKNDTYGEKQTRPTVCARKPG